MPLDPATQGMLTLLESMGLRGRHEGTPEEARAAFRLLTVDMRQPDSVIPGWSIAASMG